MPSRHPSRLAALLLTVLSLVTGCATGAPVGRRLGTVRLETGEGAPLVFTPPPLPAVRLEEAELREALAWVVLELRLSVRTPPPGPPVLLAAAGDAARVDRAFQSSLWCQPGQSPREDGCLSLLERGFSIGEYKRVQLSLSFAFDTVWEGATVTLRESVSSKALWAMVGGFAASYLLMGQVQYVGLTNSIAWRAAEQFRQKGLKIDELLGNLSREDARAVEQALIEIHGLSKNGGTLLNRINSIARSNPKYASMVRRGQELLESIDYKGD